MAGVSQNEESQSGPKSFAQAGPPSFFLDLAMAGSPGNFQKCSKRIHFAYVIRSFSVEGNSTREQRRHVTIHHLPELPRSIMSGREMCVL